MIDQVTRALVFHRANDRCEYCRIPLLSYDIPFHVDHIVALQHAGHDEPENLALSCPGCNRKKGPNLSGIDPQTNEVVTLFNPRQEAWAAHFRWNGPIIVPLTPAGRATVAVLDLNHAERLKLRQSLIQEGLLPTSPDR